MRDWAQGSGFSFFEGSGFEVWGSLVEEGERRVHLAPCAGYRVWGLWFGVWGLGFGVWNVGFGV